MAKRVLIVDDDSTNRYMLETLLKGYGFQVTLAENGRDALEKARLDPPDLIVTDILMPVMDGYALCREWKSDAALKHIPLVFYTATYTGSRNEDFALSLGAERFIIKPQEPDKLVNILKEVLDEGYAVKQAAAKPPEEEMEFFRQYNEILFRKLEKKMSDLERTNRELRILEERYRLILENATDVIYTIGTDLNIINISPSVERVLGYKPHYFIGRPVSDLRHILSPESFARAVTNMRLILQGETIRETVYECIAEDGTTKFEEVSSAPLMQGGRIAGIISVARDVTERRRAEEALRESHRRLDDIIDFLPDATFVIDRDGKVLAWNRSLERMTGVAKADMIGRGNYEYAVPFYGQRRPLLIDLTLLPDGDFEKNHYEGIHRQGDTLYAEACVPGTYGGQGASLWGTASKLRDASGTVVGAIESIRDITEQKQDEEKLRSAFEKRQELEFIVNHSPAVVWLWKAEEGWPVEYVSGNLAFYGYSPEDFTSGRIAYASIVYPDDLARVGAEVEQYAREGRTEFTQEYRILAKSGDIHWIDDRTWVRHGPDGSVTHYQGISIDITDRKEIEKQLQKTLDSLRRAVGTTVQVVVSAVEKRDPYTAGHQIRVADLARAIAAEIGLPQEKIDGIRLAGTIHDLGKLSVPAEILSKPTKLTNAEFSLIKEHSRNGYEILKDVESPWPLAEIVYQHHERMDGSGYPRNLKGDEIIMEARIMAVADVVESMASHRPYRPSLGLEAALEEIEKHKGARYDIAVADACLRLFRERGYGLKLT